MKGNSIDQHLAKITWALYRYGLQACVCLCCPVIQWLSHGVKVPCDLGFARKLQKVLWKVFLRNLYFMKHIKALLHASSVTKSVQIGPTHMLSPAPTLELLLVQVAELPSFRPRATLTYLPSIQILNSMYVSQVRKITSKSNPGSSMESPILIQASIISCSQSTNLLLLLGAFLWALRTLSEISSPHKREPQSLKCSL